MRRAVLIFTIIFVPLFSHAQEDTKISVQLNQQPVTALVEIIEKATPYKFYFISSWIDSVKITVNEQNVSVDDVLSHALSSTGINYFIHDNKVILTPGIKLTAKIDTTFFSPLRSTEEIVSARFRADDGVERLADRKTAVVEIGRRGSSGSSFSVSGYVRERKSGEPLPGVAVYVKGTDHATSTDAFGFYSMTLPVGAQTLQAQAVGMTTLSQQVNVLGKGKLDLVMEESVTQLKEVVIESDVDANVSNVQMGVTKIDVRGMKNIPKILGENDPLRVATTLPGVRTVGEGASGINVRGGHADQNLVILNEATIYNTSHFLGFFSVFNPDAIRSFELYKSGIPVQHGGRLSSTFELLMRDGNRKKISGQGGIGPVTSHLTLEFPLVKDKTSVMVGGRTTYSNWLLQQLPESVLKNSSATFYDFFARVMHSPNDKNSFYLSVYNSFDKFRLSSDTLFSYSNKLASLQWRHVFNPSLDGILSVTRSEYDYSIEYNTMPSEAFNLGFSIDESNVKWEMNYNRGRHKFTGGLQSKLYELDPGYVEKSGDESLVKPRSVQHEKGLESAIFFADNFELTSDLSLYLGLRYSHFAAMGPRTIYTYSAGLPKGPETILDTLQYGANSVLRNFHGPEYRASLRYKLGDASALKASYNRTRQYIHMLSNTVSVSPTDTWKLSDPHVLPQVADQVSVGFYRNFKQEVYEFSVETYYKWIQHILDYKTGASLLVNEAIDQQIIQGEGRAYGVEVLLRKKAGKITGWLGYAYSRTFIRLNSPVATERVNHGAYFPANYDKPHDVNLVTNYKITRRYSFALNFAYSTGRPITYPIAAYRFGNSYRIDYSDRNAFRIPDYIRVDLGFNMEGNHRIKKLAHSYWSISIYNVIGRKNPYSIFFRIEDEKIHAYKLSIFGAPIPTITYHFKF